MPSLAVRQSLRPRPVRFVPSVTAAATASMVPALAGRWSWTTTTARRPRRLMIMSAPTPIVPGVAPVALRRRQIWPAGTSMRARQTTVPVVATSSKSPSSYRPMRHWRNHGWR